MRHIKIALSLRALGLPIRRGLAEAARLGVQGVVVEAVNDLAPTNLSQTGRREFRNLLKTYNLELAALACPLRFGLGAVENQQPRIEHVRNVMALSFDLGPRLVLTEAGQVPEDAASAAAAPFHEALTALGQHGDRIGAVLALTTGLEPGDRLAGCLARFDTGGLAANFDPANLLLNGFSPYDAAAALHGRIRHVQARDARKASASKGAGEVPLGAGDLDWLQLLGNLEQVDYRGWLAVERYGPLSVEEAERSVGFLRRLVG